jgi:hypothetical protein
MSEKCIKATHIVACQPVLQQPPCLNCGDTSTRIGAGKKPGQSSLHCSGCKRFIAWVSAGELSGKGKGGGQ